MRPIILLLLIIATVNAYGEQLKVSENLAYSEDSKPQASVPKGELIGPLAFHSKIIPNTVRQYWIYVPAQYDPKTAASLLVFQDGQRASNPKGSLRVPQVMENLIAKGKMPVTIGLLVTPGNTSTHYPDNLGMSNPNHRWQEYDVLSNTYARMLIEELIPHIAKDYNLSSDPDQRMIGGTSSGAIAAFTAAWHYPNYFRKVFSAIGSYVSIGYRPKSMGIHSGGQDYPALIRREPIRPIKIFMQDGTNDLDNEWGNWFLANQQMVKALQYANSNADANNIEGPRYTLKYVWTDGKHNDTHAGMLLPEALTWLWQN